MHLKHYARKIEIRMKLLIFKFQNPRKKKFECPLCGYIGPFMDMNPPTGLRKHAQCPQCNALERHRLQYLVVMNVLKNINASKMKMLQLLQLMQK